MTQHILTMRGCTPEPLGNYLKALGVFRLIAEQADPNARAWWKDGYFVLFSRFVSENELTEWFKNSYQPSPIPAPWSVNSGWWPPDNQPPSRGDKRGTPNKHLRDLGGSTDIRFIKIRECLQETLQAIGGGIPELSDREGNLSPDLKEVLKKLENQTKKSRERARLIGVLRNRLMTPSALRWLDAVGTLARRKDGTLYPFQLLADCGAEGVNSYVGNYYARLCEHLPLSGQSNQFWSGETGQLSQLRLRAALLGEAGIKSRQDDAAGGLYSPALVEAPNIGQTFVASPKKRVNPWDFILVMEGLILWASAATRRSEILRKEQPAFPFYCKSAVGGATTVGPLELSGQTEGKSRGEIWYPIWTRPSSFNEIDRLFVEGRITQGQRAATRATQFALAVSSFGLERGISSFCRVGLLERGGSGNQTTTLAVSLGSMPASSVSGIDLGMEFATFEEQIGTLVQHHANQPKRIITARSRFEQAIFDFTTAANEASEVEPKAALNLLAAASNLEREIGVTFGVVKYKQGQRLLERRISPIYPLSRRWIDSNKADSQSPSDDGSFEYRLARAIASIVPWGEVAKKRQTAFAVDAIRTNLLPLTRRGNGWQWDDTTRSAVWTRSASLADNLPAVLRRRLIDAQRGTGEGLPLWSGYGARFSDLLALWLKEVDELRLTDLIYALSLIDAGDWSAERIDRWQAMHDSTPKLGSIYFNAHDEPIISAEDEELRCAFELPRVYSLLKLCFIGGRLPARPSEGKKVRRTGKEPYAPAGVEILNLLQAGRLSEAVEIASRKLRAKGYPTIYDPRMNDSAEINMTHEQCRRLAGLLLIPVHNAGVLSALAVKPQFTTH